MFRAALVVAALLLTACGGASTEPSGSTSDSTSESTAAGPAPKVDWSGKYSSGLKEKINGDAAAKDCDALEAAFDQADRNDPTTRDRTGEGTADLLEYINWQMAQAGCFG